MINDIIFGMKTNGQKHLNDKVHAIRLIVKIQQSKGGTAYLREPLIGTWMHICVPYSTLLTLLIISWMCVLRGFILFFQWKLLFWSNWKLFSKLNWNHFLEKGEISHSTHKILRFPHALSVRILGLFLLFLAHLLLHSTKLLDILL